MSEGRSNTGIWIVVSLLVGGVGCVGAIVLVGALAGAGFLLGSRSDEVEPIVEIAPAADELDAGLAFCPVTTDEYGEEQIRLYVQLTATQFTVEATDGSLYELPYEREAYPYDALRARLADWRMMDPNRRDLFVTTEPGVTAPVATRVVALAREVGFTDALHCRDRTEIDDLLLGDAPGTAAGDPDEGGLGGLGLSDDGEGDEGTVGLGNLGTLGDGTGGSGYGRGAGGLRERARVARVRLGPPDVRGSLSREVIRRVVQRHVNEVRFCYEQELNADPELEGDVVASFIISANGSVLTASVGRTTLGSPRAEACITQAVRRWTFPAPDGGGVVGVNQTFALSSS